MSHARRTRRVLAALACTAAAVSAGCRSPIHSFADVARPGAPEAVAVVDRPDASEPSPTIAVAPQSPSPEPSAEVLEEPIEPIATPMLDAALRRAETDEEARREALQEAQAAALRPAPPEMKAKPEPAPEPAPLPEGIVPADEPTPTADAPKSDPNVRPASTQAEEVEDAREDEPSPPALPTSTTAEATPTPPTPPAPAVEPEPVPEPPDVVELPDVAPMFDQDEEAPDPGLTIDAVRLCRKITDFGRYEPLQDQTLHPGRSALVYCELGGLEYRPEGDEFVARVATRVELIRPADGGKAWEVADSAVDRRPAGRRDVYVGTMVTLPGSIAPGEYTLRLYQADATSGRTASAELPVTIAR